MVPRIKHGTATVLSIDGGGMRGIIPALIVQDLMRRLRFLEHWRRRRRAPRTAASYFDLFAGTSSGALLTLGLAGARPRLPEEIAAIYRDRAQEIFPPRRFAATGTVRQAFTVKYQQEPLEHLLGELFGDDRLGDCRSNVLIAAYDTDHRSPFFFKHYSDRVCGRNRVLCREVEQYRDFYLRDVARATTAAPTFFEPARVTAMDGKQYTLVDGALAANNPALSAYVEARKLYRDARRYIIVSIGTGRSSRRFSWETIHRWGYLDWVSPLHGAPLNAMFTDGQSETVAHALKQLPRVEYFRFNADIPESMSETIDDTRPENMARVEALGREMVRCFSGELHRLACLLIRHRSR
jgi:uncharacterized protein